MDVSELTSDVLRTSLFYQVFFAATLVISIVRFWKRFHGGERRSMWFGISFTSIFVSGFFLTTSTLASTRSNLADEILMAGFIVSLVLLAIAFGLLVIAFIGSGIRLIRKEGLRFGNALSVGVGVLMIAFVAVWPLLSRLVLLVDVPVLDYLQVCLSVEIAFISGLFFHYVLTGYLNRIPIKGKRYDHIVVLGAGLIDGKTVSPLLAGRIKKGIEAWRQNPGSKLVMSGGKGGDERLPEARAMQAWAIEHGVPTDAVLVEEESRNTRENLKNSWRLMESDGGAGNVLVVTDNYHVYRALLLAKHLGFACEGRGARVKFYFALNALVREFVAFLVMWKNKLIVAMACCALFAVVLELIRTGVIHAEWLN